MKRKTLGRVSNFLTYTRSERNGTILLSFILLVLIIVPIIYREFILTSTVPVNTSYEQIDSFFNAISVISKANNELVEYSVVNEEIPRKKIYQTFKFNPNTISIDSLVLLGLSPKQAQVVINYRNKGGVFKTPDDLAKIHVIDSSTFHRLKGLAIIPEIVIANSSDIVKKSELKADLLLELNTVDTLNLVKLKGIGHSYARRIVDYRNLLGGFYSKNQLLEVYGINLDLLNSISQNIWIDSLLIKHININLVTYNELKNHPYITDYQAKSIIYYRNKKGTILSLSELVENKLLTQNQFDKVKHYLFVQ